jgi:predicted house-cleaning noncanonical NTP pyrophosphatase (MazG superfamily)
MKTTRTFLQKKLWRNKAVNLMEENHGSTINWRILNDQEFNEHIRIKLLEETKEVIAAQTRLELINEIADVYEVIDALAYLHHITKDDIITAQIQKREHRGGFDERTFVETATHPIGSFGEKYCLADPEKYPEIVSQ